MSFAGRLLVTLLVSNVVLRTLTNQWQILPRILNMADIPLALWVVLLSAGAPANPYPNPIRTRIATRLRQFSLVLIIGCGLNPSYIYVPATVSQLIMLVLPFLLYLSITRLPLDEAEVAGYHKALRWLIAFELPIGLLQLVGRIRTGGSSELVHGTFPGNAEQYGAFLMITAYCFLAEMQINPRRKIRYLVLILITVLLNLSIDNKASWAGLVCSLVAVVWALRGFRPTASHYVVLFLMLGLFGVLVALIAPQISGTVYRFSRLGQAYNEGRILQLGKIKAYVDILRSWGRRPHMVLVGSGLSTFYSRACRQFYFTPSKRSKMYDSPELFLEEGGAGGPSSASDSTAGIIAPTTTPPFYENFYDPEALIFTIGTTQVDSPFSPFAGLLGETGIMGIWVYLGTYLFSIRYFLGLVAAHRNDPNVLRFLVPTLGLMVYMLVNSVYGPFIETTRLTTILWSFAGMTAVAIRLQERASGGGAGAA